MAIWQLRYNYIFFEWKLSSIQFLVNTWSYIFILSFITNFTNCDLVFKRLCTDNVRWTRMGTGQYHCQNILEFLRNMALSSTKLRLTGCTSWDLSRNWSYISIKELIIDFTHGIDHMINHGFDRSIYHGFDHRFDFNKIKEVALPFLKSYYEIWKL